MYILSVSIWITTDLNKLSSKWKLIINIWTVWSTDNSWKNFATRKKIMLKKLYISRIHIPNHLPILEYLPTVRINERHVNKVWAVGYKDVKLYHEMKVSTGTSQNLRNVSEIRYLGFLGNAVKLLKVCKQYACLMCLKSKVR